MSRIVSAFKSFFVILFQGELPEDVAREFGYSKPQPVKPPPPPQATAADGALQILGILQRDGRLVDFLMEDLRAADDEQIGAVARSLQEQCHAALQRHVQLVPVIDGVENSFTKLATNDPTTVKLLGNVPASGKAAGGVLRHKGWRAEKVDLPTIKPGPQTLIVAPAEIEIE